MEDPSTGRGWGGLCPSPEVVLSPPGPWVWGCTCTLGEEQVLKGCVAPGRGGASVLPLGWDQPSWEPAGEPSTQAPLLSWQNESIPDAVCSEDSDCPPGEPVVAGNGEAWMTRARVGCGGGGGAGAWRLLALPLSPPAGVRTGRCLRAENMQRGTCEIFAWCPVETRSRPEYVAVVWDPKEFPSPGQRVQV